MNKREKEVIAAQLEDEEKVIRQLERHYRLALDDVELVIRLLQSDEQTQSKIHRINYQKKLKAQLEAILEKMRMGEYKTLQQYLTGCYTSGYVGTMYDLNGQGVPVIAPVNQDAAAKAIQLDTQLSTRKAYKSANGEMVALYESLGIDTDSLKSTIRSEITRGIASGMTYDMMARNIASVSKAPLARAKTIARTEGHRILQQSAEDARVEAKSHGADLVRQWDATLDGSTRSAHRELDGQTVELDEYFHYGTKKAKYPGGFGDPKLDCNCRCVALSRARSALDAKELEVLKERAAFFGLDKTESFRDFEKKYLKAAETIENPGKSGIIKVKNSALKNGLPLKGEPDSIVDKTTDSGETLQRRLYDSEGMAKVDYDVSDHGFHDAHPTGAHKHVFDHSRKNPRGKPEKLTEDELLQNKDIIREGVNYHDSA